MRRIRSRRFDRLRDEVREAGASNAFLVELRQQSGERQNRHVAGRRQSAQPRRELEPVHVGQQQILENQIGPLPAGKTESGFAIDGLDEIDRFVLEREVHELSRDRVVLDEQHARVAGHDARNLSMSSGSCRVSIGLVM